MFTYWTFRKAGISSFFLEHSDEGFMKLKILVWDDRRVHLYYNKRTYAVVKIKQGVDRVSLEVREEREWWVVNYFGVN